MKELRRLWVAGLLLAGPLTAQTGTVTVEEENFRAAPRGNVLAQLFEGTSLRVGERRDRWVEATVEAWIWSRSVQVHGERVVVNAGGENLRSSPNGARVGRAEGGMRLDLLQDRGDWYRVRRSGWIWRPSIEIVETEPDPVAAPPSPRLDLVRLEAGAPVLDRPDGDSVARIRPGGEVEIVAREGRWARVRVEGWVPVDAVQDASVPGVLTDLPPDSLRAHPERYRGRLVEWTVRFIALQQAERFRTDFVEGEPFVLARGPGDAGFVYLAVPADRVETVGRIAPLERIRIVGRVRSGRSALTGAPVLELVEIEIAR